jgi:hypothetical protein
MAPEVNNEHLRNALIPYGQVIEIVNEKWTKKYRYPVDNGIRVVTIQLKHHAPSHLTVAGQRTLISYEGQPTTCYGCDATGHMIQHCPTRHRTDTAQHRLDHPTYSGAVRGATDTTRTREVIAATKQVTEEHRQEDVHPPAAPPKHGHCHTAPRSITA